MASPATAPPGRRHFVLSGMVWGFLTVTFAVLLSPVFPSAVRESVSAVGLPVAGLTAIVMATMRARRSAGRTRRAWSILVSAGVVALLGNVWAAMSGADPVTGVGEGGRHAVAGVEQGGGDPVTGVRDDGTHAVAGVGGLHLQPRGGGLCLVPGHFDLR